VAILSGISFVQEVIILNIKKLFACTFVFVFILCSVSIPAFARTIEYPIAEGGYVRLLGRGDTKYVEDTLTRTFNWSNAGFEFVFKGMEAEVFVDTAILSADSSAKGNYFTMALYTEDDLLVRTERINLTEGWNRIYRYLPGDPVNKKIKFVRSSSGYYGTLTMSKLKTDAMPKASEEREILIESIGDSYTAGCGDLASSATEPCTGPNTDSWYSYATVMARHFNADNNLIALSGHGAVTNAGWEMVSPNHRVMKDQVKYSEPRVPAATNMSECTPWVQGDKKADLVTVWLGTNDGDSERRTVTDEEFEEGYKELLSAVEEIHIGAKILCMSEPSNRWYNIIKNIVSEKQAEGKAYYFHAVKHKGKNGGAYHPNREEAKIIANDLIYSIKELGIFDAPDEGDISIMADYNTGKITVSGELNNYGDSNTVAAIVTDNSAELSTLNAASVKWLGQTDADKSGKWSLSFKLSDVDGKYKYTMQALSMDKNVQKEFSFDSVIPAMTVTKEGTLIYELSELKEGDTLNVTVSDLKEGEVQNRKVIVAQYDANGALLDTHMNDTLLSEKSKSFSISTDAKVLKDVSSIKVFYWDIDTFVPFMGVYTID